MRILLVASWHHFAFLVVSVVLLGFGASGTFLAIFREWIMPRAEPALFALALLAAVTMPAAVALAQIIPVDGRLLPVTLWRQIAAWLAYWAVLAVPVFLAAASVGLSLMLAGPAVAGVYAANLLGSAVGSIAPLILMHYLAPEWLPFACSIALFLAAAGLCHPRLTRSAWWTVGVTFAFLPLWQWPPQIRTDPFKFGAHVQRLEQQGEARRIAVAYSPRAMIQAYAGDSFHEVPFLTGELAAPPVTILLADGHPAGSVVKVSTPQDAAGLDQSLPAFAYELAPPQPRVLLLGESGGINVHLAARRSASEIVIAQPDPNITAFLTGPLREHGGGVFDLPTVKTFNAEPRHVVEHLADRFDLIQLVSLESPTPSPGGLGGLVQDHLATVEGFSACLRRLTAGGILAVTHGIETPPRDTLKIMATLIQALRQAGVPEPARHVVVVRDFLAVHVAARKMPWSPDSDADRLRRTCRGWNLTPVWFPGIRPDELNRPDALPGPADSPGDWYYVSLTQLFGHSPAELFDHWPYDVRPATDDRPFFHDFTRLRGIPALRRAFGDLWLTRTELGYLFVLAALLIVAIVGAVLLLLPPLLLRSARPGSSITSTLLYFGAIGLAYMLIEMTFLSRLTHWVGDTVTTAACTFAGFLFFSGLGSLLAQRMSSVPAATSPLRSVLVMLMIVGLVDTAALTHLSHLVGSLPFALRCLASVTAIAPIAFLMGFPMPLALARLDAAAPDHMPWAWAANGFASVLASPLSVALAMKWGFTATGVAAIAIYLAPFVLFARLPSHPNRER